MNEQPMFSGLVQMNLFRVVASRSLVLVAEVVLDWAQPQLQEQLQVLPPFTELA